MLKKYLVNPFTIFPAAAVIFFWPISLFLFSLKNDALTYYYPVRTLISDALHQGELPLWTPFINMGYPLHADMQSSAWNPVVWLFGFLSNYSLAGFHYELLFYFAFAGIGFYYLCRNFGSSKTIAYTIAFAYQFSGFMIDSVQFFPCISAAGYLPWIILFYRRMIYGFKISDALSLAFFLYLSFTGGYPSFFIITAYLLAAYFIFAFFKAGSKSFFLKKMIAPMLATVVFFIALSLPAILSFIEHLKLIDRGKQQALSFVLENSMNPVTTLSLLSPFATTANNNFLSSNILMRSIYIGIIPMLFLVIAFFNGTLKKNKEILFFFFIAMIMMGMAWGKFFFLRQAAYFVLPLMDSFRHPALFRLFTIFFLLLVAAASIKEWENNKELKEKNIKKTIIRLYLIVVIIAVQAIIFLDNHIPSGSFTFNNFKNLLPQFNFQQKFLIQFPFLIAILLLGYIAVVKRKNTRLVLFLTIADLFFASQLNMPVTVIGSKKFVEVKKLINRNPVKYPIPGNESIEENSKNSSGDEIITGSTLPFTKKIGRNDYYITPGNLSLQDKFYESSTKDSVFKNPILFLSKTFVTTAKPSNDIILDRCYTPVDNNDSNDIHINSFSANSMQAIVQSKEGGMLVYLQNNYPGWRAFVDGKAKDILPVNISFMGFHIPGGKHTIEFIYSPRKVIIAWYISAITSIVLFLWIGWIFFSAGRSKKPQQENG